VSIDYQERLIDHHFAAFIKRVSGGAEDDLFSIVVSLASNAVGKGNICLNLSDIAAQNIVFDGKIVKLPEIEELKKLLMLSSAVGAPGQFRPLVLDTDGRLYLYRYWRYEQNFAGILLQKAGADAGVINENLLCEGLERFFPHLADEEHDCRKDAAKVALRTQFCVISGGPGTGKTSTVVRILALLLEQQGGMKMRIALAAPTGKAAARLKASVNNIRQSLDCSDEVRKAIPDQVVTIHRLLGPISGSDRFRYSVMNPLPYDVVIVDEASMVALPLMNSLMGALSPNVRLILLGDKDQLASVEAGAVLGDICLAGEEYPASSVARSVVMLEKNFRFKVGSHISAISREVNAGRGREALNLLRDFYSVGIAWRNVANRETLRKLLKERVLDGYGSYFEASSPGEALERFDRFSVLCAIREGLFGVNGINREIESILGAANLITKTGLWYPCRPIMITANDYTLNLFNGDIGIIFPDPDNEHELRAFFPSPDGGVRSISTIRLPQHETAFAMTVHKSQGSEFSHVLILLPPVDFDILTRELIYTGITRAKDSVEIWGDEEVFCAAVKRKTVRNSGLIKALLQQM